MANVIIDSDSEFTDSESEMDLDDEPYDDIYQADAEFTNQDKIDGHYYIGLASYVPSENIWISVFAISPRVFFQYPAEYVCEYLHHYGHIEMIGPQLQIMQLHIHQDTETYTVVLNTLWIRIIQRHWRKIYKIRQRIIEERLNPIVQFKFQIHGTYYPYSSRSIPGLRGMLSDYLNVNKYKN